MGAPSSKQVLGSQEVDGKLSVESQEKFGFGSLVCVHASSPKPTRVCISPASGIGSENPETAISIMLDCMPSATATLRSAISTASRPLVKIETTSSIVPSTT